VLDPIDGTRAFIAGRPIFGTLIALVVEDWPMLGVIDQPVLGERWIGVVGQQTLFNGTPAHTRRCPALAGASVATTSPHLFDAHQGEHYLALAAEASAGNMRQGPIYGGDCYNYGCLASGHIDVVVEAGLKFHDFAALVPVVEGAGGRMCDWQGEPLTAGSIGEVIAAGDPARIDDIVEALACGH
jgi:fructose-1,6-bisphosphatase/inositol monophosphatase family enzyme